MGANSDPVGNQGVTILAGSASGGAVVVSSGVGTYVVFQIDSGGPSGTVNGVTTANVTIPITAKRWVLENIGTGNDSTFNGTIMAGGISRCDNASPAAPITLVAGAANIITGFYSTT